MDNKMRKNTYYIKFNGEQLLGAKEILKSMPIFFNRVYFSSKYAGVLYGKDLNGTFENVTLLAYKSDAQSLRQIIKNNFLYIYEWDSVNFLEKRDFGFSFLAGNIKFIVMFFEQTDEGYTVYSFDSMTGNCFTTKMKTKTEDFLKSSINPTGEIIRTCDFNIEYMNDNNTEYFLAPKKEQTMAVFESSSGFTKNHIIIIILVIALSIIAIDFAVNLVN